HSGTQTGDVDANGNGNPWGRVCDPRSQYCVDDSILEFRVAEPNVVRKPAGVEVDSCRVHGSMINVLEGGKGIGNDTANNAVLLKRKSVEQFDGWLRLPVELPYRLQVPERRVVIAVKRIERHGDQALLGRNAVAPPVQKSFAMDIVCARARHDVDRASGCQLRR